MGWWWREELIGCSIIEGVRDLSGKTEIRFLGKRALPLTGSGGFRSMKGILSSGGFIIFETIFPSVSFQAISIHLEGTNRNSASARLGLGDSIRGLRFFGPFAGEGGVAVRAARG